MRRRSLTGAALAWLAGCALEPPDPPPAPTAGAAEPSVPGGADPPPAPREFRGAWVASVNNIDWPSQPGLSASAQRGEAITLLDSARTLGLNAIVLQVRPAGDALYPSALEPWSEYLSGVQGRAPGVGAEPAYDPLAFWIEQAHRRGLELHAWFNPYRARHSSAKSPLVAPHLGVRQPGLMKRYGDMLWMDPGEPAALNHLLMVVGDVVRRYDVDGVHIDDYFYPYPVLVDGVETRFPDEASHARYRAAGGTRALDDWRRANVDTLVESLYRVVHEIKPWVRVGISPFGIGRPERRPPGISGFSQYDKLYADVELWLERGWLDYLAPQLYWPIQREGQAFPVLLDGWVAENRHGRHLWPGLFTSQVPKAWPAQELLDQVALLRTRPSVGGHIHFSMVALLQNRDGLSTRLRAGPYAQPALPPATPWLAASASAPPPPVLRAGADALAIEPAAAGGGVARWALWRQQAGRWRFETLPAHERRIAIAGADALVLSAVDRVGQLGPQARWPSGRGAA